MNTHDIKLPPLPKGDIAADTCPVMWVHSNEQLQAYARTAIEADRKQCREDVAAALGFIRGGNYAWSYLLQQIKDIASVADKQPAPNVSALVDALETIQRAATHKNIQTGIEAAIALGLIAGICEGALASHRKKGDV